MNYTNKSLLLTRILAVLLLSIVAFAARATLLADLDAEFSPSLASATDGSSSASPDAPQLTVRRSAGQLRIEWPLTTGWILEQSPRLTRPIPWMQVSPALYQVSATNMSVAVSPPGTNMFYRLRNVISVAPIPGLSGAWRLDESQGALAQDSSGRDQSARL